MTSYFILFYVMAILFYPILCHGHPILSYFMHKLFFILFHVHNDMFILFYVQKIPKGT